MDEGRLILIAGSLLAAGLFASLVATRLRVPSLVLFLGLGMLIGSDGVSWIEFNDYELARTIGIVALLLILFEGGLTSGLIEMKRVLPPAISLAFVGTIATAVIAGLAATWLFNFSTLEGLLVGSIVAATDGAAIFSVLRGSSLRRRVASTLEAESGFNDPVAILLVIGFIDWIEKPDYGIADMAVLFAEELSIGLAAGILIGAGAVWAFRRMRLATTGLYPVASLAVAALAYGLADTVGGSGFLAVYLAGLALGGATIPAQQTIAAFHEGMAWVAQVAMFLTLGLLVFPSSLPDVALEGTVLAFVLAFVARPLGAALATIGAGFSIGERVVLGWAGLRGAIPVVLATFPVISGVPGSIEFFNIVFFAVVLSTLLQGSTFEAVAKRLRVTSNEPAVPRPLADPGTIRGLGAEILEYEVKEGDAVVGAFIRDLGLPYEALVNVVVRGDDAIPPRGSTRLRAGDRLHLLLRQENAREVRGLTDRWQAGPIGPQARPVARSSGHAPIFLVRSWTSADGDPSRPSAVVGAQVVDRLRERRDEPGALVLLEDSRYAVTGRVLAVGSREALTVWVRKRIRDAEAEQRGWLQGVLGTLGADPGLARDTMFGDPEIRQTRNEPEP